jgi:MoxR-like ATPase
VLTYDALAEGVPADHVVRRVLQTVPLPQVTPRQRAGAGPAAQAAGYAPAAYQPGGYAGQSGGYPADAARPADAESRERSA